MTKDAKRKIKIYAAAIALPLAVGGLSALLTMGNMDIYETLQTPPGAPPSWLFPVVWTVLYILMGVSSARVWLEWERAPHFADRGLSAYILSLGFNFCWSIFFFNYRALLFSFWWLVVLWLLILLTIRLYRRVSPWAAYLQIPYTLWVAYAGYLNLGIWYLNP